MQETKEVWVRSLGRKDQQEVEMTTHSSSLAWEIHGQRSLVGYTLRGHKELDWSNLAHVHKETKTLLTTQQSRLK